MKAYLLISLILSPLLTAEPRTWFMTKGTSFSAEFTGAKAGKVGLKNPSGKTITLPISNLSLVDRYYLHTEQDIPLDELDGGNLYNPEVTYKPATPKPIAKLQAKGDGYNLQLNATATPHFVLLHQSSHKVADLAVMLERIWYSHAFRTPGFIDTFGNLKKAYIYCENGEQLVSLSDYYIDTLEEELSTREISAIKQSWSYEAQKVDIPLPPDYATKFKISPLAHYQHCDTSEKYLESLSVSTPFFKWQELYYPAAMLPQERSTSSDARKIAGQGLLALVFASEIRLNDNLNLADQSIAKGIAFIYPPQKKPKDWGKVLIEWIESGELEASFDAIYDPEALDKRTGSKEANLYRHQLYMAIGRFLQKDLAHMIAYCGLCDAMQGQKEFPPFKQLAEIYGYKSTTAMDQALEHFVMEENRKF